ncbi:hypothetical protein CBA19CS22_29305 [Caballeronia novacaledonica]|uniref:Uncharacterized protein n=1 Tax=Caballeronia novacaledonica TaxID=1544861 RepID=A0ACB5R0V0_9BURK|nr:hypothetical protein CBA19CS22_29305 [Caballeronia novacaledonica]
MRKPSVPGGNLFPARLATTLASVASLILAASMLATYFLARPIRQFVEELRQRGGDLRAGPVREAGPKELRAAINAFNALQAQRRKFVDDRTLMLAAISHDLANASDQNPPARRVHRRQRRAASPLPRRR